MNIFLYLGLWMLLTFGLANGIICTQCHFRSPGRACLLKDQPCKLFVGQSCFVQTVYFGRVPIYIKQGCMKWCKKIVEKKRLWAMTEDFSCCSHKNYCND